MTSNRPEIGGALGKPIEKLTPIWEKLAEQEKLLFNLHDYITRLSNKLSTVMEQVPGADGRSEPEPPHHPQLIDAIIQRNEAIVQANNRLEVIISRLQI